MGKSKKYDSKSKTKHKRKERKEKKKKCKKHAKDKKKEKEEKGGRSRAEIASADKVLRNQEPNDDFSIPVELMNSKSHVPETPEEYKRRQSRIRREIDPNTGRCRLIKGDGEVLEEIVSRERHKSINKKATKGDGAFFQKNTLE